MTQLTKNQKFNKLVRELIHNIEGEGLNQNSSYWDNLLYFFNQFKTEFVHEFNTKKFQGNYIAYLTDYLQGLPSYIDIPAYNIDIEKLLINAGLKPTELLVNDFYKKVAEQLINEFVRCCNINMDIFITLSLNDLQRIDIFGKEWFDKVNGNSYFATIVTINDKFKIKLDFQYGYGTSYKFNSIRAIASNFCTSDDNENFKAKLDSIICTSRLIENCKKSELINI